MGRIIVEQIVTADGFVQDAEVGMKFMNDAPIDSADIDLTSLSPGREATVQPGDPVATLTRLRADVDRRRIGPRQTGDGSQ